MKVADVLPAKAVEGLAGNMSARRATSGSLIARLRCTTSCPVACGAHMRRAGILFGVLCASKKAGFGYAAVVTKI
jgi:hypothetical protein